MDVNLKRFLSPLALALAATAIGGGTARAGYAPGCTVALVVSGAVAHEFRDVLIQPDGKIVAAGYVDWGGANGRDFLVARFHPDLSLDLSFNGVGYRTDNLYGRNDEIYAIAIQSNLKIVVGGYTDFNPSKRDMAFARYNPDGSLDAGFGKFGVDFKSSDPDEVRGLAIRPDGKILAAGFYTPGVVPRTAVLMLTKTGLIEPVASFPGGTPPLLPTPVSDMATDIVIDPAGNIVLSVTVNRVLTGQDIAVVRLDPRGVLDPGFGSSSGWTPVDLGPLSADTTSAVLRQPNGSLVVAGTSNAISSNDLATVRFTAGGLLDGAYGAGGRALHDFGGVDAGHDVALDSGGNIVVAGQARGVSVDLGVARFDPGGGLAFAFTDDVTPTDDIAFALQITRAGKILLAGSTAGFTNRVATVALFNPDGSQDCGVVIQPVQLFTATASGDGANGQVILNWLNPAYGPYDETIIRSVPGCPALPTDGTFVVNRNDGLGQTGGFTDFVPLGPTYHYAAFVEDASDNPSAVTCVAVTPFDRTIVNTEWIYGTGISTMTTPGLRVDIGGGESVAYSVGNDGLIHAIRGGPVAIGGGSWPAGWKPFRLGDGAPERPLIMPLPPANNLAIVTGAEDGRVYAVDALSGNLLWRSAPLGGTIVGSPATVLSLFQAGDPDLVFVGTRDSAVANRLYALNANDGTVAWFFDNGGGAGAIGMIVATPVVDYGNRQVYFTSLTGSSSNAYWCLDYSTSPPTQCGGWLGFGQPSPSGSGVSSSPIPYKGIIYLSDSGIGELFLVDPLTGNALLTFFLGGGGANGYVFPRLYDDVLFAATADTLWALNTNPPVGPASTLWFDTPVSAPSTPLYVPGSNHLYVGTNDGRLLRYDSSSGGVPTSECMGNCTSTVVGAPAFDVLRLMIYVGTDGGEVYGVRTPF